MSISLGCYSYPRLLTPSCPQLVVALNVLVDILRMQGGLPLIEAGRLDKSLCSKCDQQVYVNGYHACFCGKERKYPHDSLVQASCSFLGSAGAQVTREPTLVVPQTSDAAAKGQLFF